MLISLTSSLLLYVNQETAKVPYASEDEQGIQQGIPPSQLSQGSLQPHLD